MTKKKRGRMKNKKEEEHARQIENQKARNEVNCQLQSENCHKQG